MTPKEAYHILGLPEGAGPDIIRKKYRQLIVLAHPDSLHAVLKKDPRAESETPDARTPLAMHDARTLLSPYDARTPLSPYDARRLNQAYALLRRSSREEQTGQTGSGDSFGRWSAPVNPFAYCPREILCHAEDMDGSQIGTFTIARGRYLWTTEEEFPLFLRSIAQCTAGLLDEIERTAPVHTAFPGCKDAVSELQGSDPRRETSDPGSRLKGGDRSGSRLKGGDRSGSRLKGSDRSGSRLRQEDLRRFKAQADLAYLLAQQFIDARILLPELAETIETGSGDVGPAETIENGSGDAEPAEAIETGSGDAGPAANREKADMIFRIPAMLERSPGADGRAAKPAAGSRASDGRPAKPAAGGRASDGRAAKPAAGSRDANAAGGHLFPSSLRDHRLYLKDSLDREVGYLSFKDDRMYYIIIPLFEQRRVQVKICERQAVRPAASAGTGSTGTGSTGTASAGTGSTGTASAASTGSRSSGKNPKLHSADLDLYIRFRPESETFLPESLGLQIEKVLADYRAGLC